MAQLRGRRLSRPQLHVASVTAWGTGATVALGTVELIVMDLGTQSEIASQNGEYQSSDGLQQLLDEYANIFNTLIRKVP